METREYQGHPYLELGHEGWRHPATPGLLYGTENSARNNTVAYRNGGKCEGEPYHVDTRETVEAVRAEIERREGYDDSRDYEDDEESGVWAERVNLAVGLHYDKPNQGRDEKWPVDARIAVYVVTGGNEGYYLHIDAQERDGTTSLIVAKSLGFTFEECHASAGRIARLVSA